MLPALGRLEAEQRARERRLAAARLADEPERLAAPPGEVDAVDRAHRRAPAALVGDVQAARLRRGRPRSWQLRQQAARLATVRAR